MLERQVEVVGHSGRGRDDLDQARTQLGGLQVADPDPLDALGGGQVGQDLLEQSQVAQVLAVRRGVLADQEQLADALAGQPAGLGQDLGRAAGHERATERRDGAERAAPVAARRDLQWGHHPGGQPAPVHAPTRASPWRSGGGAGGGGAGGRCGAVRLARGGGDGQQGAAVAGGVRGAAAAGQHVVQAGADVAVVVEAEDLRLGQLAGQFRAVALGQAAHRGDLRTGLGRGQQLVDRLLLGRLDEAARVHQHHAGLIGRGQVPAGGGQAGRKLLGVHLVAGTAQRDQANRARDRPWGAGRSGS